MAKVLIADDDPDICTIMADFFSSQGDQPCVALDSTTAVALALQEVPDIIILDLSMPGKSGFEVFAELRKLEVLAKIPVIACTAHAMKEDEARVLKAGFNGYVPKPFDVQHLASEVSRLLGR